MFHHYLSYYWSYEIFSYLKLSTSWVISCIVGQFSVQAIHWHLNQYCFSSLKQFNSFTKIITDDIYFVKHFCKSENQEIYFSCFCKLILMLHHEKEKMMMKLSTWIFCLLCQNGKRWAHSFHRSPLPSWCSWWPGPRHSPPRSTWQCRGRTSGWTGPMWGRHQHQWTLTWRLLGSFCWAKNAHGTVLQKWRFFSIFFKIDFDMKSENQEILFMLLKAHINTSSFLMWEHHILKYLFKLSHFMGVEL